MKNKTIKICFLDFWPGFDYTVMNFYHILCERYNVEIKDNPEFVDYVFFSCFGNEHWNVNADCLKIFITAENITPDFNVCDYAIGFDRIDFGDRYLRFSNFYSPIYQQKIADLIEKREFNNVPLKTDFCSFVVSNGKAAEYRVQLFNELCKYKRVNSGGRYLNNIGGAVGNKLEFEQKHKFSICCENSSHKGYTTEKIYQAFGARVIPIYWGDPDIELVFNSKAFINAHRFKSIREVVETVKAIDQDDELYYKMLNEPVYNNPEQSSYEFQQRKLARFLYNIFDQRIEDAYRYNRHGAHFNYVAQMQRVNNISKMSLRQIIKQRFFRKIGIIGH